MINFAGSTNPTRSSTPTKSNDTIKRLHLVRICIQSQSVDPIYSCTLQGDVYTVIACTSNKIPVKILESQSTFERPNGSCTRRLRIGYRLDGRVGTAATSSPQLSPFFSSLLSFSPSELPKISSLFSTKLSSSTSKAPSSCNPKP